MNEYSLHDILTHAENIETESHSFYAAAAAIIKHHETAELAGELAEEETRHFNHLRALLSQSPLSSAELSSIRKLPASLADRMIKTSKIEPDSTPLEILVIALEREKKTEALYTMFLSITDLPEQVVKTFEMLRLQETGHANRIESLRKRIT